MSEQSGTPASSGSSSAPGRGSAGEDVARRKRLARIALLAVAASILVVVAAGGLVGLFLVVVGGLGMIVMLIGGYWFLAHHGVLRWAGIVLAVAAPIAVIWAYAARDVLLVAIIAVVLMVGAGLAARSALQGEATAIGMSTYRAPRPRRAFIVMNPRSGGGKVVRFDLKAKAEALGAEVSLCWRAPAIVDVAALVTGRGRARRRPARRGRRRRHPGAGRRHRGRARHPAAGDQRRHPQPLRAGPRPGPGRPVDLPGRARPTARRCASTSA